MVENKQMLLYSAQKSVDNISKLAIESKRLNIGRFDNR